MTGLVISNELVLFELRWGVEDAVGLISISMVKDNIIKEWNEMKTTAFPAQKKWEINSVERSIRGYMFISILYYFRL